MNIHLPAFGHALLAIDGRNYFGRRLVQVAELRTRYIERFIEERPGFIDEGLEQLSERH